MRRLMSIAAFALFLAVPVWAQHGGGGHAGGFGGGGHAGGFGGGGHMGGFSGGGSVHSFSGGGSVHSFSGRSSVHSFSNHSTFSQHGPFLHDGHIHNGVHVHFHTGWGNCYGYGCRYGYGYGYGYGYPWAYGYYPWWGDDNSSYDDSYQQNVAQAAEMNRQNLAEQQMLRQEQYDGDQDAYSRPPRSVQNVDPPKTTASVMPDTVLVYRDQHTVEIQNYAIVGQTLWNFAPQHTQKIPLAQLDLPATTKANDDRGVTFRVPSGE